MQCAPSFSEATVPQRIKHGMGFLDLASLEQTRKAIYSDPNVRNFVKFVSRHGPELPRQSVQYALSKIPIIQWLPHYSPKWLMNDILAGSMLPID
jgi:solute carrier family 26 (sodium-independent sulfate anion transporter), member 11